MGSGNTSLDLSRLRVKQSCLTYVRWQGCLVGTQLDLSTPGKVCNDFPHAFTTLGSVFLMLRSWPLGRPGAATAVVPGVPGPLQQPNPRESKHELKSGKLRLEDV